MPNLNINTFVGHAGRAAQLKTSKDGSKTWYELSLAVNVGTGDYRQTQWVNCRAFGKTGEFMASKTNKGDVVAVVGKIDKIRPYLRKQDNQPAVDVGLLVSDFTWICQPTKQQNLDLLAWDTSQNSTAVSVDGLTDDNVPF
jgi:single-strand DNA-binding protein